MQAWRRKAMTRTTTQTRTPLMVLWTRRKGLLQMRSRIRPWKVYLLRMVRGSPGWHSKPCL